MILHFHWYACFIQTDLSEVTEINDDSYDFQLRSIKLNQMLGIKLYDGPDNKNSIWDATLKMNCNFTKSKVYSDISSRILKCLKLNKIYK